MARRDAGADSELDVEVADAAETEGVAAAAVAVEFAAADIGCRGTPPLHDGRLALVVGIAPPGIRMGELGGRRIAGDGIC